MRERHFRRRCARQALLPLACVAFASCVGSDSTSVPTVSSISVTPSSAGLAAVGQTVTFSALAKDEQGSVVNVSSFTWSSSDSDVATVDELGVAIASQNGTTSIQATADGVVGSATLTVNQQPASMALVAGDGQEGLAREDLAGPLEVRVLDSRGNGIPDLDVSWKVLSGEGSIAGTPTDETGRSEAIWTLGSAAGPASAQATAGPTAAMFTATTLPNGIIQGTVTPTSSFQSPSRLAKAAMQLLEDPAEGTGSGPRRASKRILGNAATSASSVNLSYPAFVSGELLVRIGDAQAQAEGMDVADILTSRIQADRAAQTMRAVASAWSTDEPIEILGASPALATIRIRVPPGQESRVREALLKRPEVQAVERNRLVQGTDARRPEGGPRPLSGISYAPDAARNEPEFALQAWHYDLVDAPYAWEVTTGSSSVIVAVVDDGIRFDHPDIADNLTTDGYDFVSLQPLTSCSTGSFSTTMDGDGPDPDPTVPVRLQYDPDFDCVTGIDAIGGHGLHVAGTIGASAGNGQGGVGLAWNVGIRPVRVMGSHGSGTLYDIAQGILYAAGLPADGGTAGTVQTTIPADIINLSLGGPEASATLQSAVQAASEAGALLVASAGNNGTSTPLYPAAYPEVLSVTAVAPDLTLASYSSFGSTVDIAGPGGEQSAGDDYAVMSLQWDFQNGIPTYGPAQGTSMAAPHVSGVAALVLSVDPGLAADQLRGRLVDHAVDLGAVGRDDSFGAGLVSANGSVRAGVGAPRDMYVMAISADGGATSGPVLANSNGAYALNGLDDGNYYAFAGEDRGGDVLTGFFDRRWGAYGGSTTPSLVSIAGSSVETASFDVGYPLETEDNGSLPTANPLPAGAYTYGTISSSVDVDLYRFEVAETTTVIIETDGLIGACGFAGQVDTVLRLGDATGLELASDDDIDLDLLQRCSMIRATVPPGTYFVEVTGWDGDSGYYGVRVSEES